ncbi:CAAX amino terminal protease family protein [Lentilactobacillus buchneri ATCC 11577]|nr:CAAX amino terminal protease family protein [Lentilactobacillus buchneri ATCC 11577]
MMNVSLFSSQIGKLFWGTFAEVAETIIVVCLLRSDLKKDWRQFTTNKLRILEIILIGIIALVAWNLIRNNIFPMTQNANDHAISDLYSQYPVIALILGSIVAPVVEELVFRKSMLQLFIPLFHSKIIAVIFSSLLFGLAHWNFTQASLFNQAEILGVVLRTGIGIIFACVYLKSKSIYSTMIMHALWNFLD